MSREKNEKRGRRGISITLKLFAYLALFTVLSLAVIWLFQVKLLNKFYERSKYDELSDATDRIAGYVSDGEYDGIDEIAEYYASEYGMGVLCCRIDGVSPTVIYCGNIGFNSNLSSVYHGGQLDRNACLELRDKAVANDGRYTLTREMNGFYSDFSDDGEKLRPGGMPKNVISALCVQVVEADGDTQYLVALNSLMTPLDSTVDTLKAQFVMITAVLLSLALIFALVISYGISKPIIRMNQSAKQLAKGNYDADFSCAGYREVSELSDTLSYAADELSRSDKLKRELIANVSHDLRTPLTMIRGYAEVMRDIPGENTPENMQAVIEETERLSGLVNDLLSLSKLNAGTLKISKESFDLTQLIGGIMSGYDKMTGHENYDLRFNSDRNVTVFADRTGITQVVYNLINNAINYCGEDKFVCVTQSVIGDKVRVSVADHGAGIPPEQIPLIWDRYYKADEVHKRAQVGTGLGLSIVKGVLDAHGFIYGIESKLGEGAIFWFEMPYIIE